ncbi:MAG: hypothetical protein NC417_12530 [Candidatus Gastranaerophilales bacterium]|nr:hypothetical protein [Candidatus Gastranaerophilales bacterium]
MKRKVSIAAAMMVFALSACATGSKDGASEGSLEIVWSTATEESAGGSFGVPAPESVEKTQSAEESASTQSPASMRESASTQNSVSTEGSMSGSVEGSSGAGLRKEDLPAAYQEILDIAYDVIVRWNNDDDVSYDLIDVGVPEALIGRTAEEGLAHIGYTLYDVDKNGVEELIIADTGGGVWDNRILNMFTIQDDQAVAVLYGWSRNRYYILNDGKIYYEGSGGAAYTTFATYRVGADGVSLETIDYYFTDYLDGAAYTAGITSWFHNTTGQGDVTKSEVMELEDEEIPWKMQEEFEAQVMPLDLTFFKDYR